MRHLRRKRTRTILAGPAVSEPAALVDAHGHPWDPTRYRVGSDGTPKLTSTGKFWLLPGQQHAAINE